MELATQASATSSSRKLPPVAADWLPHLEEEFAKEYMQGLRDLLKTEAQDGYRYFPQPSRIFYALQKVSFSSTRVVILGQDPYHGEGQANGLAFAVSEGTPLPPSLRNIFQEIQDDLSTKNTPSSSLESWADQGVLLLNTVLTVRAHQAFSHRGKGWEIFTDKVIQCLNKKQTPVVFLLWGKPAQAKASLVTNPAHKILQTAHPSPLSAHRGFLGCRHFSKTNAFLRSQGLDAIRWDG